MKGLKSWAMKSDVPPAIGSSCRWFPGLKSWALKSDVPPTLGSLRRWFPRIKILGYENGCASGNWMIVPLVPRIEALGYEIGPPALGIRWCLWHNLENKKPPRKEVVFLQIKWIANSHPRIPGSAGRLRLWHFRRRCNSRR